MTGSRPILYSFRRCPYAMRARLALHASEMEFEHREILLRDKPASMLAASPKGTVPVLVMPNGQVLDESLDIMHWALEQSDPEGWLDDDRATREELIGLCDGPFKHHLDRYKYATRYEDADPDTHRASCFDILRKFETLIADRGQLNGSMMTLADAAIFPFVRQFAHTDKTWFDAQDLPHLQAWLAKHLTSERFAAIMGKHPLWQDDKDQD
ncbi:glutathione S-transferase [Maricaulis parjimensis]|uniref:glutathione S-transferase n=1 Tax=Maricaulis parjimensis TaxID=144023 RepID=UPI00193A7432|nr:glutathione S-transferase [Maricaulis parjimensis]